MTIDLTTFVPGTKAKADEVNANFTALKDAVNDKAAIEGDSAQTFSVAVATQNAHAVNKSQLDGLSTYLMVEIDKITTKFCVKSGNTTNGKGDLFSYEVLEITPKIAGTYDDLVIVDYAGTQTTISTTPSVMNLTGASDGEYNIFIKADGKLYILNNTIYKQAKRPTMVSNDIWFNTSVEPFKCIKYLGASEEAFLDVPLGKVVIASSAITSIETFAFNQNGYEVNQNTLGALTKCWISAEYTPVVYTPTIVTHNLNINPLKVCSEVLLKCVIAEFGYSVGDYISMVGSNPGYWVGPPAITTFANSIQIATSSQISTIHKSSGTPANLTNANWRYVFRIWY